MTNKKSTRNNRYINKLLLLFIVLFLFFSHLSNQPILIQSEDTTTVLETSEDTNIEEMPEETTVIEEETPLEEQAPTEIETQEINNEEEVVEPEEEIQEETPVEEKLEEPTPSPEEIQSEEVPLEQNKEEVPVENKQEEISTTPIPEEQKQVTEEINYPAFSQEAIIDDVVIKVSAKEGIFPEGASLSVTKISQNQQVKVDQAIDEVRKEDVNVATSYTFDIKVLDTNNEEIQPKDQSLVQVSFALAEVKDQNLDTEVYHVDEELNVTKLDVETTTEEAIVETTSFSYYTVEFTYNNKQYVLNGDTSVKLEEVLSFVELTGEVTSWEVSNPALFNIYQEDVLYLKSLQPFSTEEWLKVTIDGIEYVITVTDDNETIQNPPIVNEGVDFESDIVYNDTFSFPTIRIEGIDDYTTQKYFHRNYTRLSTLVRFPINGNSPTITVDYGVIGTFNGERIVLTVTFSEFYCTNKNSHPNFRDTEVFKFDYAELDNKIQEDLGDTGTITTKYYDESLNPNNPENIEGYSISAPSSTYANPVYLCEPDEMSLTIANDPRYGYTIFNISKCKVNYDLRYEDGTPLNNPAITFASLNSHTGATKAARSVPVADTIIDGVPVQYRINVPSTYYYDSKVETVKPINPIKLSVAEQTSLMEGPFNFKWEKGVISDYNYTETEQDGVIIRTWNGSIVDDEDYGWYYATPEAPTGDSINHPSKLDYMYNPLTGRTDKLNDDIAITVFYDNSRNMEAYVGDIRGQTWQTSKIIAKGPHYDLTIQKETNTPTTETDNFNFKVKIWKDIVTEDIVIDEDNLTTQAYAYFDSTNSTLTFFRDEPGKYTNGQIDGTKTYYTNFEHIPVRTNGGVLTDIPWNNVRTQITKIVFEDDIIPINCDVFFADMPNLSEVEGENPHLKMHKVEAARAMFRNCSSLTSLDTSNFYMPSCRVSGSMFMGCSNLEYLDLTYVNFEKFYTSPYGVVTGFADMFNGCSKLSTEIVVPCMPMNFNQVFKDAATAPGAEIKFKAYALLDGDIQGLINVAGPNSHITFDGYVDDFKNNIPDYFNQGEIIHTTETTIFNLLEDPRFTYDLSTQEYSFTLNAGESITINDIPKSYQYQIYEVDENGNEVKLDNPVDDTWTLTSIINDEGRMDDDVTSTFRNTKSSDLTLKKETQGDVAGSFDFNVKVFKEWDVYQVYATGYDGHSGFDFPQFFYDNMVINGYTQETAGSIGQDNHHFLRTITGKLLPNHSFLTIDNLKEEFGRIDIRLSIDGKAYPAFFWLEDYDIDPEYYDTYNQMIFVLVPHGEEFNHTWILDGEPPETYSGIEYYDLSSYGGQDNQDGSYKFTLANGESVTIPDLPEGTKYEIIEEPQPDWFIHSKTNDTGTIETSDITSTFVNEFIASNELTLEKEVTGNMGNKDSTWEMKVNFETLEPTHTIQYAKIVDHGTPVTNPTYSDYENNSAITLGHLDQYSFIDIPEGIIYTITETQANQDGYTTTYTNQTYTYPDDYVQETKDAKVVNHREAVLPTGVVATASTGLIIAIIGIAGLLLFRNKKKEDDE